MKQLLFVILLTATPMSAFEPTDMAANAINTLGIELLHRSGRPDANALLSPYSIQSALAMIYAGAEGDTRTEMARVLHYSDDDAGLHRSFAALRTALEDVVQQSARQVEQAKKWGASNDPVTLTIANRLFGQSGYDFREPFLTLVKDSYNAPFETLDFAKNPQGATKHINAWVEDQTRQRIRNLIPDGALDPLARLVLVNAIYLKAPWAEGFREAATKPLPFHVAGGAPVNVPTMMQKRYLGYSKHDGYSAVGVSYAGEQIHFLILLPDNVNGLAELEKKLNAKLLSECAILRAQEVVLHLPRFRLEPPVMRLNGALRDLGMKRAFDEPRGGANFERIAPRRPEDYLYVAEVFHKTFLNLDEKGTEAAAATAVTALAASAAFERPKPIEVHVDRPFIFAIQHRASGTCLFLGHVTDPR